MPAGLQTPETVTIRKLTGLMSGVDASAVNLLKTRMVLINILPQWIVQMDRLEVVDVVVLLENNDKFFAKQTQNYL